MPLEVQLWEVTVSLDDIHNDRPPCDDVAVLRLVVEDDVGTDDFDAESGITN